MVRGPRSSFIMGASYSQSSDEEDVNAKEEDFDDDDEERSTAAMTASSSNPFNVVTSVTHTSGWDPRQGQGRALLCIGTLEYSKTTTRDQNDLYLMKTVPTGSICADLHDEFMVTFIDKRMTKENAEEAYQKISEQKRVIKHVHAGGKMLETRMNGDVARNFRVKGGFCKNDGLHVIVPRKGTVTEKESSFRDGESLTIKKLFQKMRQHGCDYLVIIGNKAATKFSPVNASSRHETTRNVAPMTDVTINHEGYLEKRARKSGRNWKKRYFTLQSHQNHSSVLIYREAPGKKEKGRLVLTPHAKCQKSESDKKNNVLEIICDVTNSSGETLFVSASSQNELDKWLLELAIVTSKLKDKHLARISQTNLPPAGETKSSLIRSSSDPVESVSKWTPPIHGGKALIVNAHSELGNDSAAKKGYTMQLGIKKGEFMVSYTSPLSTGQAKDSQNAIDKMKDTKSLALRTNSAFTARINGHWTPNYSLSMSGTNDPANKEEYMGLWVLDPRRSMEQVENWKDKYPGGYKTTVKELFARMKKEFDCDYLVVLGCKVGLGHQRTETTRKEMLRIVEVMEGYPSDETVQEWGMDSIVGLKYDCKMEEEGWMEECKRVIDAVLKGMEDTLNAGVARAGCDTLWNLAANNNDNQKRIAEAGGIEMILRVMEMHRASNAEVAKNGCGALGTLAVNGENQKSIEEKGGIAMSLRMMKKHGESNAGVAENGCSVLLKLAYNNTDNQKSIEKKGGIAMILRMMERHGESNASVAENGCGALYFLADNNDVNNNSIGEKGGIGMILRMMEKHGASNASIAKNGCSVLWNLAINAENKRKILTANGVSMVERMKSKWKRKEGVKTNAANSALRRLR